MGAGEGFLAVESRCGLGVGSGVRGRSLARTHVVQAEREGEAEEGVDVRAVARRLRAEGE